MWFSSLPPHFYVAWPFRYTDNSIFDTVWWQCFWHRNRCSDVILYPFIQAASIISRLQSIKSRDTELTQSLKNGCWEWWFAVHAYTHHAAVLFLGSLFRNGRELVLSPNMKTWHDDENVKLKISSAKMNQEGTYTCVATNCAGTDECSAFITVEGETVCGLCSGSILIKQIMQPLLSALSPSLVMVRGSLSWPRTVHIDIGHSETKTNILIVLIIQPLLSASVVFITGEGQRLLAMRAGQFDSGHSEIYIQNSVLIHAITVESVLCFH